MLTERDLEDMIYNSDPDELESAGLPRWDNLLRQVNLGSYGIADLIDFKVVSRDYSYDVYVTIIELKKEKLSMDTIDQCLRYFKGLETFFPFGLEKEVDKPIMLKKVDIVLIGNSVCLKSNFTYLLDFLYFNGVSAYTINLDFNGITFNRKFGYCQVDHKEPSEASCNQIKDHLSCVFNWQDFLIENEKNTNED